MAYHVHLPQVARTIVALPGETIQAAALREDLAYHHGGQTGRCGSCKSRLLPGEVLSHSPFALDAPEHPGGRRALPGRPIMRPWTVRKRHE